MNCPESLAAGGYSNPGPDLSAGYAAMAADEAREADALALSEALLTDVADEPIRDR